MQVEILICAFLTKNLAIKNDKFHASADLPQGKILCYPIDQ
jgi:hypothetical protein